MFDDTTRATPDGQPIRIAASGATLSGMLYSPSSVPVAVIVLNGATGVPQPQAPRPKQNRPRVKPHYKFAWK